MLKLIKKTISRQVQAAPEFAADYHLKLEGCHDVAPNVIHLTLKRMQRWPNVKTNLF